MPYSPKMRITGTLLISLLLLFTLACAGEENGNDETEPRVEVLDAQEQKEKIEAFEKRLSDLMNNHPDSPDFIPAARYLAEEYRLFADNHPEHESAAEMMFRAANLQADALDRPMIGIGLFRQVQRRWPDSEQADRALFLAGYTYNHAMNNEDEARKMYEKLMTEYPESELRAAAEDELRFMGTDIEEFLRSIREQDQDASP